MIPLDQTCQVKKAWLEIASDNHSRIFTTLLPRERDFQGRSGKTNLGPPPQVKVAQQCYEQVKFGQVSTLFTKCPPPLTDFPLLLPISSCFYLFPLPFIEDPLLSPISLLLFPLFLMRAAFSYKFLGGGGICLQKPGGRACDSFEALKIVN